MEIFDVRIEERLVRHIRKEAHSAEEAEQAVSDEWHDGKHILTADDFQEVSFAALPIDSIRKGAVPQ